MLLVRTLSPPSPVRPGGRGTLAASVLQQWAHRLGYVPAMGIRRSWGAAAQAIEFFFFRGKKRKEREVRHRWAALGKRWNEGEARQSRAARVGFRGDREGRRRLGSESSVSGWGMGLVRRGAS